ncbi:MAG: hypothetical protein DHS20C02_00520 [Micavibrio sp.]|nr:MAG: hypothetical protein DHS20C02_00520 [Micavibrio sp.]
MPHEDRRIIFDYEEIYKALYSLCVQKERKKPPSGVITMLVEDDKDDSRIYVRIENELDKSGAKIEYSRDFLAAALMVYCRGCGIPLPKKARKSVMIREKDVILRAEM